MGMAAYFAAVNEKTLSNLCARPDEIPSFLYPESGENSKQDCFDSDESWHSFHFALTGEINPEASVLAKAVLGGREIGQDMGYGPARYFMPEEVRVIAAALSAMNEAELSSSDAPFATQAAELDDVEISTHDANDTSENVREDLLALRAFYQTTAARGDGIITWIVKPDFPVFEAMPLAPEKSDPPNIQSRTASAGFCYLLSALWLGMGVYIYTLHEEKSAPLRLAEPTTIEVQFQGARCYPDPRRRNRAIMEQTYTYVPELASEQSNKYEVIDLVRQPSLEACELALPQANKNPSRSHVWYDKTVPTKARWDIDNDSPHFIIWFTLIGAGILFAVGRSKRSET